MAHGALGVVAFNLDHRLEKGRPFGRRKLKPRQGRMVLIAGGNQPDGRQDIAWGCNPFGAVGYVGGGLSPLPFPGLLFTLIRAERYNQLPLTVIAQDGCSKRGKLDFTALKGSGAAAFGSLSADKSIVVAAETAAHDTAAEIAALFTDSATAINHVYVAYNAHNVASVYMVADAAGTAAGNVTATLVGTIDLADTGWATLTAANFA